MNTVQPWALKQEAAFEAYGMLEVLYESGALPAYARDLARIVVEKYRAARKQEAT